MALTVIGVFNHFLARNSVKRCIPVFDTEYVLRPAFDDKALSAPILMMRSARLFLRACDGILNINAYESRILMKAGNANICKDLTRRSLHPNYKLNSRDTPNIAGAPKNAW